MNNDNGKSGSCSSWKDIASHLAKLKSLIAHAIDIEEDTTAVMGSLRAQHIDPRVYPVDSSLAVNLEHLQEILSESYDFQFREFSITALNNRRSAVIYLEGMADYKLINTQIIEKLMLPPVSGLTFSPHQDDIITYLKHTLLTIASVASFSSGVTMDKAVSKLLSGDTLLLVDGEASLLIINSRNPEIRSISEPENETSIRSAREGFVEELQVNLSLIRRRLKNPNLIIKNFVIGTRSNTDITVLYFRGIVNQRLVHEVELRLKKIKIDAPLGIGFVQGLLEDHPYSLFPTMLSTERPDKFTAALLEGKVGILMDCEPFGLLAPATLADLFQTSDDYNEKWLPASMIRFTRYFSALFAMATPAFFVAITTFHPGLLPAPLVITIAIAHMDTPFPAFFEALIMIIMLEILQEAGLRLPKTIGPAVSIVGGLVIGEAIVRAGMVSAPMVIVIAFTAIASFDIANYRLNLIVRLFRIPLMMLGSSLGMFGVMIGLLAMIAHFSLLESFGVPYLAPLVPENTRRLSDLKDTVVMLPPEHMKKRPGYLMPEDNTRQKQ